MNATEIRKKVEKGKEIKSDIIFFIIAAILFVGLYLLGYKYNESLLNLRNIERFLFFVAIVTGVLIYESIVLFRYYGYDEPEDEPESVEPGVMGSYRYSSFRDRKRYIFMLSAVLGGINAYLYLLWLGYLSE
jgi:hypothetical protein